MTTEQPDTEKLGFKERLKAQAFAMRLGLQLPKEQADVAVEGIQKFQAIIELSQKANTYVYDANNDIKPDADYDTALSIIGEAIAKMYRLKPAAEFSATLGKQLYKSFQKLQQQRVILQRLQEGKPCTEAEQPEIEHLAEAYAKQEWERVEQ